MFDKLTDYVRRLNYRGHLNLAISRGVLARQARTPDPTDATSWEFSAFSQNGEDGIIEYLLEHLVNRGSYFVEIGASDGTENNSTYLALVKKYAGIMVEGDPGLAGKTRKFLSPLAPGLSVLNCYASLANIDELMKNCTDHTPDLFSLDIDGNDYHIADALLSAGLRPRVAIVEYNAVFGPERKLHIPYEPHLNQALGPSHPLHFGASISSLQSLFQRHGYRFLTVDSNGVNAIFIDPDCFAPDFVASVRGLDFADNFAQVKDYRTGWKERFDLIDGLPLEELP